VSTGFVINFNLKEYKYTFKLVFEYLFKVCGENNEEKRDLSELTQGSTNIYWICEKRVS